ncbi:MAG TPA: nucleotidyltransferase domain-containing protein [Candidatus Nanoarchaeia archaeon]|nr:nucleotidyltransferase domain-containing protein [Candidatus Nanoarchaeia archaeon]
MLQKYSRYKLLEQFFDCPRKSFHIREISRKISLALISVINHLDALCKEGLVLKEKGTIYNVFKANRENPKFKLLKQQNIIWRIHTSGFISSIEETTHPTCIILFGSASRGEDTDQSDIDIFIQAKESPIPLAKYEKSLNRKINLLFEPDLKTLSKELLNNLINGKILSGYLKAV